MSDEVIISPQLSIPLTEIQFTAIRAQGAGGQNVNKVASAVHLRFDIRNSPSLPPQVRDRLLQLEDRRITADGVLIIKSQSYRTRERNRRAALERLRELIRDATIEPKTRRKTRPSQQAQDRRLDDKRRRAQVKRGRRAVPDED